MHIQIRNGRHIEDRATSARCLGRSCCCYPPSMFGWEFFRLADHLKVHIEVSRSDRSKRAGNRIKYDHYHRLYFVLYWLVTGAEFRQIEAFYGWSKSAVQLEMAHMLRAIIHGVDQFLQLPSIEERERMGSRYTGLFQKLWMHQSIPLEK